MSDSFLFTRCSFVHELLRQIFYILIKVENAVMQHFMTVRLIMWNEIKWKVKMIKKSIVLSFKMSRKKTIN